MCHKCHVDLSSRIIQVSPERIDSLLIELETLPDPFDVLGTSDNMDYSQSDGFDSIFETPHPMANEPPDPVAALPNGPVTPLGFDTNGSMEMDNVAR